MEMSPGAACLSHSKRWRQFRGERPREFTNGFALNAVRARGRTRLNPAVKFTGLPGHRAAFDCVGNWLPIETPSGIPLYVLCIRESERPIGLAASLGLDLSLQYECYCWCAPRDY